jgi:hypothetical protein
MSVNCGWMSAREVVRLRQLWNRANTGSISCSLRVPSVLQGVCRAVKEYFSSPVKVARLWMHECERVFQDRMINPADATRFSEMLEHARKKNFEDLDSDALAVRPLIFTAFTSQTPDGQPVYTNVDDYHKLKVRTRSESLLKLKRNRTG